MTMVTQSDPNGGVGAHTPGPWELGVDSGDMIPVWADDAVIAHVDDADDGFQGANARLIAAAPELLEALLWLRAFWRPGSDHDTQEVQHALATADAVIAKARGEVA